MDRIDLRIWSAFLCLLMCGSIFMELVTPSIGAFTFIALALAAGSVILGYQADPAFGYGILAANLVLAPTMVWLGMHFLKRSPLMHTAEIGSQNQNAPGAPPLTRLLGQSGTALTPLRPAGSAMIGNERVDVVSQGKFVEANTPVKVIHIEGSRVVVEPI